MKKLPLKGPFLEVERGSQSRVFPAAERIIRVINQPAVGIPMVHFSWLSRGRLGFDGNRLAPLVQAIIQRKGDMVSARSLTVIDDGGDAFLGEECSTAVHAVPGPGRRQHGRMPFPMDHVRAGYVSEGMAVGLVNVVQVIPAFVEDRAIRVARYGPARSGMRQVVGQPGTRWIGGHGGRFRHKGSFRIVGYGRCAICESQQGQRKHGYVCSCHEPTSPI